MSRYRLVANLRTSVWFVPVVCVLGGVILSFGTLAIDRITRYDLVPRSLTGGPDAATAILSTVATAEVTLCALVLTVTMVVVQLAMGQFSPRIVQTFLQDKPSQIAIGSRSNPIVKAWERRRPASRRIRRSTIDGGGRCRKLIAPASARRSERGARGYSASRG